MSSKTDLELLASGWQDSDIAKKYARTEAATRPFAEIFLEKASLKSQVVDHNANVKALDLACGTGCVTAAIYESLPSSKWDNVNILAGDISDSMLDYLKTRGEKAGWKGLRTEKFDGADIKLEKEQFTHVFANAILFFLPLGTLGTIHSLLQPNGFVGMTTWGALGWYDHIANAISRLSPSPPLIPFKGLQSRIEQGNAWHEPSFVRQQLEEAGFKDVDVLTERKKVPCGTPEQFLETMSMPMTLVASYWDEGVREQTLKDVMNKMREVLSEEAGGESGQVHMEMEGIVGVGWRRE